MFSYQPYTREQEGNQALRKAMVDDQRLGIGLDDSKIWPMHCQRCHINRLNTLRDKIGMNLPCQLRLQELTLHRYMLRVRVLMALDMLYDVMLCRVMKMSATE
jgi:hypothetical protein